MDVDERTAELKAKRICRFCMSQDDKLLSNIYSRENRLKNSVPLPLQIMACVSIEVFTNDQMPSTICEPCRKVMDHCYRFKQICKKSDTMLKQFPLTGVWPERLELPKFMSEVKTPNPSPLKQEKSPVISNQKFKRPAEAASPTSSTPKRSREDIVISSIQIKPARSQASQQPKAPKLLNKSAPKILNKNAVAARQQQYDPVIKTDEEGNVEIITEIFDNSQVQYEEPDPVKFATPVETNVFPCDKCERSFPLKQLLDIHYANHTRERSFECNICEKRFFSKYDLGKHMLIHTGEKPYECVVCAKRFSRSTLLFRHEKIHTDQPKFLCAHCERPFLSELELEKHSETHKKSRPFQCRFCSKGFAFKQGLERHETTHSKVQPFPCEYCEKSFPTSSKLARHLTAHAGERPYPCKLCPKSFLLSHHLSRHLRSHGAGTGSYKCTDCDNVFTTRDDLIYHSAVHATQNLTCPLCKEQFDDLDSVTEHIKSHCDGEQFACDYCDLIFITEDKREEHCSDEHAEDHKGNELGYHIENAVIENHLEGESIDEYVIEEVGKNIRQYVKKGVQVKSQPRSQQADDTRRSPRIANSQVVKTEASIEGKEEIEDEEKEENIEFILCDGNADGNRQIEIDEQEDDEVDEEVDDEEFEEELDEELDDDSDEDFVLKKTPPKKIVDKKSTEILVTKFINSTQTQKKIASPEKNKVVEKATAPVKKPNEAVQKVIKNLPKGMTISKKEVSASPKELPVETKKEKISPATKPLPTKKPQATYAKKPPQQSPSTSSTPAVATVAKKNIISPQPIKKENILEDPLKPQTKLIEMKIGDKMVKVQKIVMTKSQVAAMTKKGKIEMKDGAMILKQSGKNRRFTDGDDDD